MYINVYFTWLSAEVISCGTPETLFFPNNCPFGLSLLRKIILYYTLDAREYKENSQVRAVRRTQTFWTVKTVPVWGDFLELALSWCTMIFSCSFFEYLRRLQANKLWCNTQNWPPHEHIYPRHRWPFASKCFFHEQHSLNLAHFLRHTRSIPVLFRAHKHRFINRHLWQSYKCLLKHRDWVASATIEFIKPSSQCYMMVLYRRAKI